MRHDLRFRGFDVFVIRLKRHEVGGFELGHGYSLFNALRLNPLSRAAGEGWGEGGGE